MSKIAEHEMKRLLELAEQTFDKNPERAKRYVFIARKIGMKTKTRFPQELRKKFCRGCGNFLKRGHNCDVKVEKQFVKITCRECGKIMRYPK